MCILKIIIQTFKLVNFQACLKILFKKYGYADFFITYIYCDIRLRWKFKCLKKIEFNYYKNTIFIAWTMYALIWVLALISKNHASRSCLLLYIWDFRKKKYLVSIIREWYPFSGPPLDFSWPVPLNAVLESILINVYKKVWCNYFTKYGWEKSTKKYLLAWSPPLLK